MKALPKDCGAAGHSNPLKGGTSTLLPFPVVVYTYSLCGQARHSNCRKTAFPARGLGSGASLRWSLPWGRLGRKTPALGRLSQKTQSLGVGCVKRLKALGSAVLKDSKPWGRLCQKTQSLGVGCVKRLKALGSAESKDSKPWGRLCQKTQSLGVGCVKRLKALGSAESKDSMPWGRLSQKTQSLGVGCVKRLKALGSAVSKDSNLEEWLWLLQGLAS